MWMQETSDNNLWSTREVLKKIPMENILGKPILGSENQKKKIKLIKKNTHTNAVELVFGTHLVMKYW